MSYQYSSNKSLALTETKQKQIHNTVDNPEEIFDIIQRIGEGAYGAVYKALDKRDGIIYAIKIMQYDDAEMDIDKEILMLKTINSPNIIQCKESYLRDDNLWIIMDFCNIGSILDVMRVTQNTLKEEQIQIIMRECLIALKYLHSKQIICGNMKASNIMLSNTISTKNDAKIELLVYGYIRKQNLKYNHWIPNELTLYIISFYRDYKESKGIIKLGLFIIPI